MKIRIGNRHEIVKPAEGSNSNHKWTAYVKIVN